VSKLTIFVTHFASQGVPIVMWNTLCIYVLWRRRGIVFDANLCTRLWHLFRISADNNTLRVLCDANTHYSDDCVVVTNSRLAARTPLKLTDTSVLFAWRTMSFSVSFYMLFTN